jgi:hypothetical protein
MKKTGKVKKQNEMKSLLAQIVHKATSKRALMNSHIHGGMFDNFTHMARNRENVNGTWMSEGTVLMADGKNATKETRAFRGMTMAPQRTESRKRVALTAFQRSERRSTMRT